MSYSTCSTPTSPHHNKIPTYFFSYSFENFSHLENISNMTLTFISKIFGIYNSPVTLLSQIPCLFHLFSWLNSHLLCEFWPIFAFVSLIFLFFNHNLCKQHDCLHWPKQCAYISMTNYFPSKDFFFFFTSWSIKSMGNIWCFFYSMNL